MRDLSTYRTDVLQQIVREGWSTDRPNDSLSCEARSILRERGANIPNPLFESRSTLESAERAWARKGGE